MSNAAPSAGWYLDSKHATQRRYWDGARWTDHYLPLAEEDKTVALSSPGELAGHVWSAFRARPGALLALTAVPSCVAFVVFGALLIQAFSTIDPAAFFVVGVPAFLVIAALHVVAHLMIARVVMSFYSGRRLSIGGAWKEIRGSVLPIFGVLLQIAVIGAIVVAGLLLLMRLNPAFFFLAYLVLVPTYVYAAVKLGFVIVAAAANRNGSIVRAAARVSRGRFWAVFGRILFLGFLGSVPGYVMQIAFMSSIFGSGPNTVSVAIFAPLLLLANAFAYLVLTVGLAKIYLESGGATDMPANRTISAATVVA